MTRVPCHQGSSKRPLVLASFPRGKWAQRSSTFSVALGACKQRPINIIVTSDGFIRLPTRLPGSCNSRPRQTNKSFFKHFHFRSRRQNCSSLPFLRQNTSRAGRTVLTALNTIPRSLGTPLVVAAFSETLAQSTMCTRIIHQFSCGHRIDDDYAPCASSRTIGRRCPSSDMKIKVVKHDEKCDYCAS
jgi:hypothetical protein